MKYLSLFLVALLVAISDTDAARHQRLSKENREADLTKTIDSADMDRIKQRYLRTTATEKQNVRMMMESIVDLSLSLSVSMSMSMSMPETRFFEELSMSMSISMSIRM